MLYALHMDYTLYAGLQYILLVLIYVQSVYLLKEKKSLCVRNNLTNHPPRISVIYISSSSPRQSQKMSQPTNPGCQVFLKH